jgi:predicted esterase
VATPQAKSVPSKELEAICRVVHQFSVVGGEDYDPKPTRLRHVLERLPSGGGSVTVYVEPASAKEVSSLVHRHHLSAEVGGEPPRVDVVPASSSCVARSRSRENVDPNSSTASSGLVSDAGCQIVVNYDLPTAREYARRVEALVNARPGCMSDLVVFSLVEGGECTGKRCKDVASLLRQARTLAARDLRLGGPAKASELDSVLEQLDPSIWDEDADEDETEEDDEKCCWSGMVAGATYHYAGSRQRVAARAPDIEVVRIPLASLDDLPSAAAAIAPRLQHTTTVICLHCLWCHTPWDGYEHLFAPSNLGGPLRVVLVLADDSSWHDYVDTHTLCGGGASWMDMLDVNSMERADGLLAKLIDHEAELLGGCSERIVLAGSSQGGGQAMLRFLRSDRLLGGCIGSVCHVPTAPHTPRSQDPLATEKQLVNRNRPVRLLAGELDSVFPPSLVLRDAERLRADGGFTDVTVRVEKDLCHEGGTSEGFSDHPDLCHIRKHLASIVGTAPSRRLVRTLTPDSV